MEQLIRRCNNFSKLKRKEKVANTRCQLSRIEEIFSRSDSWKIRPAYIYGILLPLFSRKTLVEFFDCRRWYAGRFLLSANVFSPWSGVWIVHKFIYLITYDVHSCLYAYLNIEVEIIIILETDEKNTASSKVTWKLFWLNVILFLSSNVARVLNKCLTVALLVVYISSSVHIFIILSPSSFWGLQGTEENL